jgi:hypothetical protein
MSRYSGSDVKRACARGRLTLLPQTSDGADEEALECTDRLTTGLALSDTPSDVGLGCAETAGLSQRDAVQDGIEPSIATAVQPVAHETSGGRFQRCHASVRSQLRFTGKALAGTENARRGTGREQTDAAQLCQAGSGGRPRRSDPGPGAGVGRCAGPLPYAPHPRGWDADWAGCSPAGPPHQPMCGGWGCGACSRGRAEQ